MIPTTPNRSLPRAVEQRPVGVDRSRDELRGRINALDAKFDQKVTRYFV